MKWCVFIAVLGVKPLQNNQSLQNFCFWGCKAAVLLLMWFFFFPWKIALLWRMQMLADLYHRILSDIMAGLEHQNFECFPQLRLPWNSNTGHSLHSKDIWMRVFQTPTTSNFHQGFQNKPATGAFHRLFWILRWLLPMLVGQFRVILEK